MQKAAREKVRVQKKEEFQQGLEEKRSKLRADFDALKAKIKED